MPTNLSWVLTAAGWLVVPLVVACGANPGGDEQPFTSRDSAGVQIVQSHGALWTEQTRWRLSELPLLEIGAGVAGDPALQFGHITGVHRSREGTLAVVDAWAPAIAFFDAAGGLLGRLSSRGNGPGEFPPGRAVVRGSFTCGRDTVYVLVQQQIAAYHAPGEYIRTFRLEQPAGVRGCAGDAVVTQQAHTPWRTSPGVTIDSILLVLNDLDGSRRSVLDSLPIEERAWSPAGLEGTGYARLAFGHALSTTGGSDVIATAFGGTLQVELRDLSGALLRIVRVPGQERTVGSEDIERFREFVFNPWSGNEGERLRLEEQLVAARGRQLPAVAELRFDDAGNIWARRYDHVDAVAFYDRSSLAPQFARPKLHEERRWDVFRVDGRYLGAVTVPQNFEIHEVGEDWVLGVWRDDLDIESVRQYQLIKPAG